MKLFKPIKYDGFYAVEITKKYHIICTNPTNWYIIKTCIKHYWNAMKWGIKSIWKKIIN